MRPGWLVATIALIASLSFSCTEELEQRRDYIEKSDPPFLLSDLAKSALPAGGAVHVVYVPAYGRVFVDEQATAELTVALSIRNTDERHAIEVAQVRHYSTRGEVVDDFVTDALELPPMASGTQPIGLRDRRAGAGANFVVHWRSPVPVSDPIIEAVMIGQAGRISFVSRGVDIDPP